MRETSSTRAMSLAPLCDPSSVFLHAPYAKRLRLRMAASVEAISRQPGASFPKIFTPAGYDAFSRLVHNPRVVEQPPLSSVVQDTATRLQGRTEVLALHDTTEFRFGGETRRAGLGRLKRNDQGFLGHVCLAVGLAPPAALAPPDEAGPRRDRARRTAVQPEPLGVLHVEALVRADAPQKRVSDKARYNAEDKESRRWWRGVEAAEAAAPAGVSLIHVMDREADEYQLIQALHARGRRFVIRQSMDRLREIPQDDLHPELRHVRAFVHTFAAPLADREIEVSARGAKNRPPVGRKSHPPRGQRTLTVRIESCHVDIARSGWAPTTLPAGVALNVVHVVEIDPPVGEKPVEWWLYTTEPIETDADVLRVVDLYRARWMIEEFFKALKTGCSFEQRQLESFDALWITLILLLPIATRLLQLRHQSRVDADRPATDLLDDTTLAVLRATGRRPLGPAPTVREALLAIAALGGHLARNGAPGWITLWKGMTELLTRKAGWEAALEYTGATSNRIRGES